MGDRDTGAEYILVKQIKSNVYINCTEIAVLVGMQIIGQLLLLFMFCHRLFICL